MAAGYLDALYRGKLALLTDLYQLTMAHGYWLGGVADRPAVFHLFFRRPPFGGGYAIAAGLGPALDYLEDLAFDADDLAYLAELRGGDGKPLFDRRFVDALRDFRFTCTIDAVPEGRAVFPHEPLLRVEGPMLAAQLVETPLLTMINYQTLVATKASRVCQAAGDAPVLEFGLRRAQGPDGGVGAARAAWIGGCAATSNVLAGRLLGMPVRGTHAHSWVMAHDDELSAFRAYAAAMPNNCTFLVDTYDTDRGVANAIAVGRELRAAGHELSGIRLDSGDLAHFSAAARRALDDAGFSGAKIVASNDLDETLIASLREQGAAIDIWGVGTKLVTCYDQPALGGVYKLGAIRDATGAWRDTVKVSEQPIKVSNPGVLGVRRFAAGGRLLGDVIFDVERGLSQPPRFGDMDDLGRATPVPAHDAADDLLVRVMDRGRVVVRDTIEAARERCRADLAALSPRTRRFLNPQPYPVGLDPHVQRRKRDLLERTRGEDKDPAGSAGGAGAAAPEEIDLALGRAGDHP